MKNPDEKVNIGAFRNAKSCIQRGGGYSPKREYILTDDDMISTNVNEEKKILKLRVSCAFHNYPLSTSEKLLSGPSPCRKEVRHFELHGQNVTGLDLDQIGQQNGKEIV